MRPLGERCFLGLPVRRARYPDPSRARATGKAGRWKLPAFGLCAPLAPLLVAANSADANFSANSGAGFYGSGWPSTVLKAIKDFRASLPDKIGNKSQVPQGGYMYLGKTPASFRPKERIDTIVWNELLKEGGSSSINTYDSQILTWGFGFGGALGGLPSVMEKLFALCPAAKDLLLDAGIGLERVNGKAVWLVVNTATGAIECGNHALQMMKVDK